MHELETVIFARTRCWSTAACDLAAPATRLPPALILPQTPIFSAWAIPARRLVDENGRQCGFDRRAPNESEGVSQADLHHKAGVPATVKFAPSQSQCGADNDRPCAAAVLRNVHCEFSRAAGRPP
jgi:hypothetical protein